MSTHHFLIFLVFIGDNFFKSVSYSIEVLCAAPFSEEKEKLRAVEAQILSKRVDISKFESEYREVWTFLKATVVLMGALVIFFRSDNLYICRF